MIQGLLNKNIIDNIDISMNKKSNLAFPEFTIVNNITCVYQNSIGFQDKDERKL